MTRVFIQIWLVEEHSCDPAAHLCHQGIVLVPFQWNLVAGGILLLLLSLTSTPHSVYFCHQGFPRGRECLNNSMNIRGTIDNLRFPEIPPKVDCTLLVCFYWHKKNRDRLLETWLLQCFAHAYSLECSIAWSFVDQKALSKPH